MPCSCQGYWKCRKAKKRGTGLEDKCVDLVPGEAVRVGIKGMESIQEPGIQYRRLQGTIVDLQVMGE